VSGSRKENNHGIALLAFTILIVLNSPVHATTIPNITIVSCYDGDTCRATFLRMTPPMNSDDLALVGYTEPETELGM